MRRDHSFCERRSLSSAVIAILLLGTQTFASTFTPVSVRPHGPAVDLVRGQFTLGYYSVVTINADGTVSTLTSDGDVGFNQKDSPGVAGATRLVAGDFNGDGKLDIAVIAPNANQSSNLAVLLGNGDGTFQSPQFSNGGPSPRTLAVADFNGDGRPDVAVGASVQGLDGHSHNTITVRFGDGAAGFGGTVTTSDVGHKPDPARGESDFVLRKMVAAGFNADGKADIALITTGSAVSGDVPSGSLDLLLGNGAGGFTAGVDIVNPAIDIELADANQDGKMDLLVPYSGCITPCEGLRIFQNKGDATFTVVQTPFEASDYAVLSAEAVDLNNDGRKDLIVSSPGQFNAGVSTLAWTYKQADGSYGPVQSQDAGSPGSSPIRSLAQVDIFDANGVMDIAGLNPDGSVVMFANSDSTAPRCFYNPGSQPQAISVCRPDPTRATRSPVQFLAFPSTGGKPVTAMKVYVDGVSLFSTPDDHISKSISIANGTHRVTVKAWNIFGPYSKSFSLTVSSTACQPPTTSRTVTICSPGSGSTVSSPVRISAGMTNGAPPPNDGIKAVKIYIDGVAKYVFGSGTRQVDVAATMLAGSHRVTVRAWDFVGGSWSSSVTFTVK